MQRRVRLPPDVLAALESRTRDHVLTTSGFFPCSIDREYLYGYAADGYRSPVWLCAAYNGSPALVHRHRGHKVFFHVGIQDRQLVVTSGIHYFDAHRLQPDLLDTLDCQIDPGSMKLASPDGAGDTVNDPSSDEEAASTDDESDLEDPTVAWCPPIPDAAEGRPCGVVGRRGQTTGGGSIPRWSAGKPQSGDQPKGTWHRPQKKYT